MSNYNRTTRECSVNQLHPELRQAVQNYFQEHGLDDPETEILMCCETISEKKNAGKLASWLDGSMDETAHMGMVLTSELLIWAHRGDRSDVTINAANLNVIQVEVYQSWFTRENGLEIFGFIISSKKPVRGRIGMGKEEAAQKFCEAVQNAITALRPPSTEKRGIIKWLSPR